MPPRLGVIIASTRPGRVGLPVANWIVAAAEAHGGFEVERIDLAEIRLPFLDEPKHPRLGEYEHEHTKAWSETIAACDVFAFVMPEYNYGVTAPLKNAFDLLHREWSHKAVAFVSYGGVSAGLRAASQMTQIVSALNMTVAGSLPIPFVRGLVEDGTLRPNEVMEQAAPALLDELARVEEGTRSLRPRAA